MEQIVSVIVPVHNTADFLDECLQSIVNQSYDKLQIIIVNDASTDQSAKIIDQFKAQDSRIECITNYKKMGVGFSRNVAIKSAKGDYLYFADSDDMLHEKAIEYLMQASEPDMIYTGHTVKINKKDEIEALINEQRNHFKKKHLVLLNFSKECLY